MATERYEHLRHLLGAYFHQDWDLEAPDWSGVVCIYRNEVSNEDVESAAGEIEQLLAEDESEEVMARLLREFGCYYDPRLDPGGPTYREWLSQLAAALRNR